MAFHVPETGKGKGPETKQELEVQTPQVGTTGALFR